MASSKGVIVRKNRESWQKKKLRKEHDAQILRANALDMYCAALVVLLSHLIS
jgi:hypothetical protein